MHSKARSHSSMFGMSWSQANAALAIMLTLVLLMLVITVTAQPADAQTFQVIHNFSGQGDGSIPLTGLTIDTSGNLYGTTGAGAAGHGTVFLLNHAGSAWLVNTLYAFAGGNDGSSPGGRVSIARDGTLYGATEFGGGCDSNGCGTVYRLVPPASPPRTAQYRWTETVLYRFNYSVGRIPSGDITFDHSGNIYGTTQQGGTNGDGVVYELSPSPGGWTETTLYAPADDNGAQGPEGGVVFDNSGNLYGVLNSYSPAGAVFQLSPTGSGWTTQILHVFSGSDGANPGVGLIIDPSGNLYGATQGEGSGGGGTVFALTPTQGGWTFNTLYSFQGEGPPYGPLYQLMMDSAGNLYGTTYLSGAYGYGSVFKLTPDNGSWTHTSLHDFTGGSDGRYPVSNVIIDAHGNLYGTAAQGGAYGVGVIWEISP
jgi:uncharacterized repeat protein (TIGR03803 family)